MGTQDNSDLGGATIINGSLVGMKDHTENAMVNATGVNH